LGKQSGDLAVKQFVIAAVAAAALLSACGGGGNSGETKVRITSVKVVGASLADSGAFGYKFTVQPTSASTVYQVYSERIASTYGLAALCPYYTSSTGGASYDAVHTGCTNFAVAGSAINFGVFVDTNNDTIKDTFVAAPSVPTSQVQQLIDMGSQGFGSGDLLIVGEGSANDTATLVTAYLTDAASSGATNQFRTMVTTLLGSTAANALFTADSSGAAAGVAYMKALADMLVTAVKDNALDNGATRVVMLNTLDVTLTPKFQAVLAGIAAGSGGQAQADQIQALARAWIQAYNTQLAADVAPYASKVAIVDFYTNFNAQLGDLSQYGLSNSTSTVCDQAYAASTTYTPTLVTAGTTSLATPAVVGICTDSYASSITPTESGGTSDWWKTYVFADNFHPTPYGHQLLGQLVAKRLTEACWL
jgi:outer membrane lipase/esterase